MQITSLCPAVFTQSLNFPALGSTAHAPKRMGETQAELVNVVHMHKHTHACKLMHVHTLKRLHARIHTCILR